MEPWVDEEEDVGVVLTGEAGTGSGGLESMGERASGGVAAGYFEPCEEEGEAWLACCHGDCCRGDCGPVLAAAAVEGVNVATVDT